MLYTRMLSLIIVPFAIKPLVGQVAANADTAPAVHNFGANLASFPTGTITRK